MSQQSSKTKIGIEKISVYPCSMSLDMLKLGEARGQAAEHLRDQMMVSERGVCPTWEDPVTMAVNAALPMLTEEDRESIELVIVGTESSVDQEKALSTWVHRYLGLKPNCRTFEIKNACYSSTAGLQMALNWLIATAKPGAKALIVGTDMSRMHLNTPYEYVKGAGAAAVLVSRDPKILEIEVGKNGYFTNEVSDLMRPTLTAEVGNTELSLLSYLDAVEGAYAHYVETVAQLGETVDLDAYFKKIIYHCPFGGMTFLAHKTLCRKYLPMSLKEMRAHFNKKSADALTHIRRMGGIYSSSTFVELLSMIEVSKDLAAGDRIGVFSFGSGSAAEFYSGRLSPTAFDQVKAAGLGSRLDERYALSISEYEQIERERTSYVEIGDYDPVTTGYNHWYEKFYQGKKRLVYKGMKEFYRYYDWS